MMANISAINEDCLLIQFAEEIDLTLIDKIAFVVQQIEQQLGDDLLDITPSYTTILVHYDLLKTTPLVVESTLQKIVFGCETSESLTRNSKLIELPAYYHPSVGWDLSAVAQKSGLSIEQVISLHSETIYSVCAVGFAPGFAFLAQVPAPIQVARHISPRSRVPAGSVAIADKQTAVYPADSPGGWQIIGNCPIKLFDLNNQPISPFSIGDRVKFKPIFLDEFLRLGGRVSDAE